MHSLIIDVIKFELIVGLVSVPLLLFLTIIYESLKEKFRKKN